MHIKGLHRNIYRLYRYARTQECLEKYKKLYQTSVDKWDEAKANGGMQALAAKYTVTVGALISDEKRSWEPFIKASRPPRNARNALINRAGESLKNSLSLKFAATTQPTARTKSPSF